MTDVYRPGQMDYRKTHTLGKAADSGDLVICECRGCRRTVVFLATDLLNVLPRERDAYLAPFPCSKCKSSEYIKVTVRVPQGDEYGVIRVRRFVEFRKVAFWRTRTL